MLLKDIAAALKARLVGDGEIEIHRVANLVTAGAGEISFLSDPKYKDVLGRTQASAVIVREDALPHVNGAALVMADPYVGFALTAQLLDTTPPIALSIHPSAIVEEGAVIGRNVGLGPHVYVEAGAVLEDNVQVGANGFIGRNARLGEGTRLYPNVTVYHDVQIGAHCLLQASAVIGSDGFGYANDRGTWLKIPQTGRVVIGSHVEIGACTTIDRGAIDDTVIGDNVIIDNQCQIAHNVQIGYGTAVAGATVIAGSVKIGKFCIIGGTCVLNGHITICDGVTLTGKTTVMRSIDKPGVYSSGIPAQTNREWRIATARILHINDVYRRVTALESEVRQLRQNQNGAGTGA